MWCVAFPKTGHAPSLQCIGDGFVCGNDERYCIDDGFVCRNDGRYCIGDGFVPANGGRCTDAMHRVSTNNSRCGTWDCGVPRNAGLYGDGV